MTLGGFEVPSLAARRDAAVVSHCLKMLDGAMPYIGLQRLSLCFDSPQNCMMSPNTFLEIDRMAYNLRVLPVSNLWMYT